MFVYGIHCPVTIIQTLSATNIPVSVDYYMEYGLLIFPEYTIPTYLQNPRSSGMGTNTEFMELCKIIIENKPFATKVEREHPYISEYEDNIVWTIKEQIPNADVSWFYVPYVHTN